MKNFYFNKTKGSSLLRNLRFGLVALLMMVGGTAFAQTITFDATTDLSESGSTAGAATVTKDGITIAVENGILGNGSQYRCYKGFTMTITSTVGDIESVKVTCTANGTTKYGPGCFTAASGTYTYEEAGKTGTWTGSASEVVLTAEANQVRMTSIEVTIATASDKCATPVLSPASGESFAESLTVTATTATEGAKVVYNTDGGETYADFPADGLTLNETTTIYAKTVDPTSTLTESAVVEATYTKLTALEGIKGLRAQIDADSSSTSKDYLATLTNAVVTFVSGNIATIEEDGAGIYFYGSNTFEAGQTISGTVQVAGVTYSGYAELTSIDLTNATVTSGDAPAPTVVTIEQLQNDFGSYGLRYVELQGVTVTTACTTDNRNGAVTQDGNTLTVRSNNNTITMDITEDPVNVVGVCVLYKSAPQLMLFSSDDVTTGIDSVVAPAAKANSTIYDLSGRRVKAAVRGLYIVNGQKVYVK